MEQYIVDITPLTPIWTGDKDRRCTSVKTSGIIGSLRWWYEALLRSLGDAACDPTESRCTRTQHCATCELFGCTGWSRKFKLDIETISTKSAPNVRIPSTKQQKNTRPTGGIMSPMRMKFIPLKDISPEEWSMLNKTLSIISDYGAIGARISQGNGVVTISENKLPSSNEVFDKVRCSSMCSKYSRMADSNGNQEELPNLSNFFFSTFEIIFSESITSLTNYIRCNNDDHEELERCWKEYAFLPIAPHLRDALRRLEENSKRRHEIFGSAGNGSRLFVSHGYTNGGDNTVEIRIWGYDTAENQGSIENIIDMISKGFSSELQESIFQQKDNKEKVESYIKSCTLVREKSGKEILEDD